jgi:hypothetical protein
MAGVYMDPETIAKENEEKMAQNTATTPTQQTTELSGQAAPTADTAPKPGAQAQSPTKVTANMQGGSGGFQQANQVKIQALGNVAQQRIGERLSAANQAIQGQKAARVEDVNAQKYAGPQNASLESLGANAKIGEVMAGAGRQADISKAAGQVAGFGAYNELRNLASGGMNRGYTQSLGLNGGGVDATLARANAQANQGVVNQVRAANNQVKAESANLLKPIEEAGSNVSRHNTAAEQNIIKNLTDEYNLQKQKAFDTYDAKAKQASAQTMQDFVDRWKQDYKNSIISQVNQGDDLTRLVTSSDIDAAVNNAVMARSYDKRGLAGYIDPGLAEKARRLGYVGRDADQSETTKLRELSHNQQLGLAALNRITKGGLAIPELGAPQAATSLEQLRQQVGAGQATNAMASADTIKRLNDQALARWNQQVADVEAQKRSEAKKPITLNNYSAFEPF